MLKIALRLVALLWLFLLAFLWTFNQLGQLHHPPLLAYVVNAGYENSDIMLADVNTAMRFNISNDEAQNGNVLWSMDGRYLVFRSSLDIYWTFFVLDTESWQVRELVAFDYDVSLSSAGDNAVIFSDLGRQIIISLETGEEISFDEQSFYCAPPYCDPSMMYPYQLELSLVEDAVFVELVDIDWSTIDFNTLVQQMLWSSDGESLIFRSNLHGQSDLYMITMEDGFPEHLSNSQEVEARLEAGFAQRLTNTKEVEDTLAWSVDMRWIAFTQLVNGYSELFVLELATGRLTNISQSQRPDSNPIWQP